MRCSGRASSDQNQRIVECDQRRDLHVSRGILLGRLLHRHAYLPIQRAASLTKSFIARSAGARRTPGDPTRRERSNSTTRPLPSHPESGQGPTAGGAPTCICKQRRRKNGHCHNNAPFSGYSLSISPLLCTSPCNGCQATSHQTPQLGHKLGRFLLTQRAGKVQLCPPRVHLHCWRRCTNSGGAPTCICKQRNGWCTMQQNLFSYELSKNIANRQI